MFNCFNKLFKNNQNNKLKSGYVIILNLEYDKKPLFVYYNRIIAYTCAEHLYRVMSEFNKIISLVNNETRDVMLSKYAYRAAKALMGCEYNDAEGLNDLANEFSYILKEYCIPSCYLDSKLNKDNFEKVFDIRDVNFK